MLRFRIRNPCDIRLTGVGSRGDLVLPTLLLLLLLMLRARQGKRHVLEHVGAHVACLGSESHLILLLLLLRPQLLLLGEERLLILLLLLARRLRPSLGCRSWRR